MGTTPLGRADPPAKSEATRPAASGALEDLVGETMLYLHLAARQHGLTLVQLVVLRLVDLKGPMAPSALADHLGISRPAATSTINVLEADGWIVRSRPEGDRRSLRTSLTPRGRRVLEEVARDRRAFLEGGLSQLGRVERTRLLRLTARVVNGLRALRPADHPHARGPE
jgi:MarR family transcriptional regulator, organic hydroperoxide resistance regulator